MTTEANPTSTREGTACPFCGGNTRADVGRMALMIDDRVTVIEDVPARICDGCLEQFYDEHILFKVDQVRGKRFAGAEPRKMIQTPVYAWEDL